MSGIFFFWGALPDERILYTGSLQAPRDWGGFIPTRPRKLLAVGSGE